MAAVLGGLTIVCGLIFAGIVYAYVTLTQPSFGRRSQRHFSGSVAIDADRLETDVTKIVELGPRDAKSLAGLTRVADFIATELSTAGGRVERQTYLVGDTEYQNVVARYGPEDGPRLVLGAHYDTCGPLPGADDNASGVAGVLALARLFAEHPPTVPVELVAYCLEEPPYFRTPSMGSAVHARRLKEANVEVELMISLEMLGFYSDVPDSQRYPLAQLGWFYPSVGNFITVVGAMDRAGLSGRVKRAMMAASALPVEAIVAPKALEGIDFSDHMNYWNEGFPAVMVTDTSFYRNEAYHTAQDTPDTLDYQRMGQAVLGLYNVVLDFQTRR